MEWLVLGVWSVLGLLFWVLGGTRRRTLPIDELRALVVPR
jgi:hypothetical protein